VFEIFKDWFHLHYVLLKDFAGPTVAFVGITTTAVIAGFGFHTFGRWKREKIEERRIDIALEALSVAYESQGIFASIRNPGAFPYEWEDMPRHEGESDDNWKYRTTYYVPLKRMNDNKEFFIKVLNLQPRVMAVFGPEVEEIFAELNWARVHVQVSAQSLMRRREDGEVYTKERAKRRTQMEADIWFGMGDVYPKEELPEGDRVQKRLDAFKGGIVKLCRPIVDREFKLKV
jgi:hypothetical protein